MSLPPSQPHPGKRTFSSDAYSQRTETSLLSARKSRSEEYRYPIAVESSASAAATTFTWFVTAVWTGGRMSRRWRANDVTTLHRFDVDASQSRLREKIKRCASQIVWSHKPHESDFLFNKSCEGYSQTDRICVLIFFSSKQGNGWMRFLQGTSYFIHGYGR